MLASSPSVDRLVLVLFAVVMAGACWSFVFRSEPQQDHYQILQVSRSVSATDLKRAYRKLMISFRPDAHPNRVEWLRKQYEAISHAYDILSNPESREYYDKTGMDPPKPEPGFMDFQSMFEKFGFKEKENL